MEKIKKEISEIVGNGLYYDIDENYIECLKDITDIEILRKIKESFIIINSFLNGDYQE